MKGKSIKSAKNNLKHKSGGTPRVPKNFFYEPVHGQNKKSNEFDKEFKNFFQLNEMNQEEKKMMKAS